MDLKIKDVAELLHVSEKTILHWLETDQIPAYKLKDEYLFSRTEIENWVISQSEGSPSKNIFSEEEAKGIQQFSLYRALYKGGVYHDIPGSTKEEVIGNAMKRIAPKLSLDADVLTDLLLDREKLMPTALGKGIAVPHTRDFLLPGPFDVVAVVFPSFTLDYGALDGKPVFALFLILACADKRHLHLLAKIAHFCNQPDLLTLLREKPSEQELLQAIRRSESLLKSHSADKVLV